MKPDANIVAKTEFSCPNLKIILFRIEKKCHNMPIVLNSCV